MNRVIRIRHNNAVLVTASIFAMTAGHVYAQGIEKSFNIPSGPASISVPEFAKQSGMKVLATATDLEGVSTNAVSGNYTPEDALKRLLEATPLTVRVNDNGTVLIAKAAPVASASASDVVVVTGFKQAYANAVKTKRNTIQISDSISSDGLGRFPDLNVGEAIQRIPGIQINREGDSRMATINLRGLPGTYARTTLNGVPFADPILSGSLGNSTPFGAFNSDIFSAITIIKSPTAADPSGGLTGNIDLRIAPALGRKDGGSIKVSAEYDELGDYLSPSFTVAYNKHLSSDFAVFGTYAYKEQNFRRDTMQVNTYALLKPAQVPNYATLYPTATYPNGVYFPSQVRQFLYDNHGTTASASAGFEWRVNDNLKVGTTAFYTKNDLNDIIQQFLIVDNSNASSIVTPTGSPFLLTEPNASGAPVQNAYINAFTFTNGSAIDSSRLQPVLQQTYGVSPTVEWKNAEWRLSGTATLSRAHNVTNQLVLDTTQNPHTGGNGITGSVSTGGSDLSDFRLSLTTPNAVHMLALPYSQSSSTVQLTNSLNDRFTVSGTNGSATNSMKAVQGDIERYLSGNFFTSIQFGARIEQDEYRSTGSRGTSLGTNAANVNSSLIIQNPDYASNFFGGTVSGVTSNWVGIDPYKTLAAITPVNYPLDASKGLFIIPYGLVNDPTNSAYYAFNFTNANDITSAYVMGNFSTEVLGVPVRGNGGVHFENTKNTITAIDRTSAGTFVPHTYKQDYTHSLPSLVLAADLTDKLVLRFAGYSTFVRPQPRDYSPTTQVTAPASPSVTYTVALGGTELKPYTADSLDLSLEWYNRPNGVISLDVFQKKVKGNIQPITDITRLCPADGKFGGVDYGLGTLTVVGNTCQSSVTINTGTSTANALVAASGSTNGLPLTVTGVEFNVQQNLDFLPAPWSNLGGAFNYAYTKISGKNPNGTAVTLPGVSKNNINLIGYYETPKYGVRFVYNYRDKYDLAAGGTFLGAARTVKARGQLDLSAAYHINSMFDLSLDAFNLTDATRAEYENDPMKPRRLDYDGRTYQLTVRASF